MAPLARERESKSSVLDQRRSDAHFHRLLDKLPAGAYTCDAEGLITYYNQRAADVWGRKPNLHDPVERFCGSFKLRSSDGTPVMHDACWMALALRNDREYNGREIVVEREDGKRITVLAHANPIHDEDGRLVGAVNVLIDITERKRAEEALKAADRAKDGFLATLSHELRNPLAPIRTAVAILRQRGSDEPEGKRALEVIERQMQHMTHLLDDLLDVSRITGNKLKLRLDEITLSEVLDASMEISRPLIDDRGHEFDVHVSGGDMLIYGDVHRLAQAVSNLLNNAAVYTPRGGHIILEARGLSDEVRISVRDNGPGIAPEVLAKIFETFARGTHSPGRSNGGLGVGLPLAKHVVEMHHGSIEARSGRPGTGSEFTIRLPVWHAATGDGARANAADAETVHVAPETPRVADQPHDSRGEPQNGRVGDRSEPGRPQNGRNEHQIGRDDHRNGWNQHQTEPDQHQEGRDERQNSQDDRSAPVGARQRVLVVDDNQDVVDSTVLLLELMDVDVRAASTGREALEVAADFYPNIVLLDIGMPEMDGLETARAMRQQAWGRTARLIAVTGWGQEQDIRESREAGFDDHVVKPMDPDALMDLIRATEPETE